MYSFLSFSLSLSFSVSELGGFGRTGRQARRQARRQAGEESRGGVKFNVAKWTFKKEMKEMSRNLSQFHHATYLKKASLV